MAESNGLLNRHRGNSIGGSNPPLSAIYFSFREKRKVNKRKAVKNFVFIPPGGAVIRRKIALPRIIAIRNVYFAEKEK